MNTQRDIGGGRWTYESDGFRIYQRRTGYAKADWKLFERLRIEGSLHHAAFRRTAS